MSRIIKPEGVDLMNCINAGYAICNECGAIMDRVGDDYVCPSCGETIDALDYEYENDDEEYDDDDIPEGCAACGGPYPQCKTSCKLFDD